MALKIEIRNHDGSGRTTKILSEDKVIMGPNLIEPRSVPVFHNADYLNTDKNSTNSISDITIGYLPALHNFSEFKSEQDVLNALKENYLPHLKQYDFISFPLDKASSYRAESHYPDFIFKASQELGVNFGWIFSEKDSETDWSGLKDFPLIILGDLSTIFKNQRQTWKYLVELDKKYPLTLKYAPALPPVLFPLFAYLGIDFFDTLYGQYMAQNNIFLDFDEAIEVKDYRNFNPPCICSACAKKSEFKSAKHWLTQHNQNFSELMIRKIQYAINQGILRDLVKKYILI